MASGKISELHRQLVRSDDRSLAIAATAAIEQNLVRLLQEHFIPLDDQGLAETFYDPDALLGTLSRRIRMAYLLGILPRVMRDDIDRIRKIRNVFAHRALDLKFSEAQVAEICAKLQTKAPHSKPKEMARWQFFETAVEIHTQITLLTVKRVGFQLGRIADQLEATGDPRAEALREAVRESARIAESAN
jgi:DNA-binding MltR family transcriptional regulator